MAAESKLSRTALRKLAPGEKVTEHGVTFERRKDGHGVWSINIMVDRVRVHRVIGRESDGITKTQCEAWIDKTRTEARAGRLGLPKGRKVGIGFREAAADYVTRLREEGGKNISRKERQLQLHLTPFFGQKALAQMKASDVARYCGQRRSAGAEGSTINRELAVLSHLFNKAIEWEWIGQAPRIQRFRENRGRIVYLTAEQCQDLLQAARADSSLHIHPFIMIALATAMRAGEILAIRKADIDLNRRRIFIPQAKAGARDQPVTQELAEFLEQHMAGLPKGTEWLFPSIASKSGHLVCIRQPFRRVVLAAGLDPDVVVRHTLRHTAITHLVQAGVDLPTVQKISGHKTLAMVARYSHANGAHIDAAMTRLQNRLGAGNADDGNVVRLVTPELHKARDGAQADVA
jgi:integrase